MKCPRCGYVMKQVDQAKKSYAKAYTVWSAEDNRLLAELVKKGTDVLTMSEMLGRQPYAIKKRMELLGLVPTKDAAAPTRTTEDVDREQGLL